MKKILIYLLLFSILLSSCTYTNPPRKEDDIKMTVYLKRSFVRKHAKDTIIDKVIDETFDEYFDWDEGETSDMYLAKILLAPILLPLCVQVNEGLESKPTHAYIWPHGYSDTYLYKIYWGKNIIYLPRELEGKRCFFTVLMEGKYEGEAVVRKRVKDTNKRFTLNKNIRLFEEKEKVKPKNKDIVRISRIETEAFAFNYPYDWFIDNRNDKDNLNKRVILKGASVKVVIRVVDMEEDLEKNTAVFKESFKERLDTEEESKIVSWGKNEGEGVTIRGKLLGIVETTVKFFNFTHKGKTYIITINYNNENECIKGLELIRDSFELKDGIYKAQKNREKLKEEKDKKEER